MQLSDAPFQFFKLQLASNYLFTTDPPQIVVFCLAWWPKFTCVSFVLRYIPRAQHREQEVKKQYLLNKSAYNYLAPG